MDRDSGQGRPNFSSASDWASSYPSGMESIRDTLGWTERPMPTGGFGGRPNGIPPNSSLQGNGHFRQAKLMINSWALGSSFDLLLLGIIFAQCYRYYMHHAKTDYLPKRLFVLCLLCLACFKSAIGMAIVYSSNDIVALFRWADHSLWGWMKISSWFLTSFSGVIVHTWFLKRIIDNQRYYTGACMLLLILSGMGTTIAAIYFGAVYHQSVMRATMIANASLTFIANLSITLITRAYSFSGAKSKEPFHKSILFTTIPMTLCAFLIVILLAAGQRSGNESFIVPNFLLAKFYIICLLRVLNLRPRRRVADEHAMTHISDFVATKTDFGHHTHDHPH